MKRSGGMSDETLVNDACMPKKHQKSKLIVTGCNLGVICGHSVYKTADQLLLEMKIGKKNEKTPAMWHGLKTEPEAREWYSKKYNKKVILSDITIPEWDTEIGGIVDGFVDDDRLDQHKKGGIIEIKCPERMYTFDDDNAVKMKLEHYDQIQFYLAITDREWCDYIVYKMPEVKIKRIVRNREYWEKIMYPLVLQFKDRFKNYTPTV